MGNALLSKPVMAQRVLRVLGRAEDPVAVRLQLALVGADEFAERLLVAGPGPVHQVRVHRTTFPLPRPLLSSAAPTSNDTTRSGTWAALAAANSGCLPVSESLTAQTAELASAGPAVSGMSARTPTRTARAADARRNGPPVDVRLKPT